MKISKGKIRLENKIIDLSTFQARPKITEEDLERYFNSFIANVGEIGDYFEDTSAFEIAIKDSGSNKRPKLVARETRYPFMWLFRTQYMPFDFLRPSTRRLQDDYFMAARCITSIPIKVKTQKGQKEEPLDERLQTDISEKFKHYPEYEGIIEIPNDKTQADAKSTTFHEALHYFINRYHAETGRNFVNVFIKKELPQLEKYQAEQAIHERAVEILTDKLLNHDPDAQFENRWVHYSLNDGFRFFAVAASAIGTGVLLGMSINQPYLLPIAFVPGRIKDYAVERHKKSRRDKILKPVEYPRFKI